MTCLSGRDQNLDLVGCRLEHDYLWREGSTETPTLDEGRGCFKRNDMRLTTSTCWMVGTSAGRRLATGDAPVLRTTTGVWVSEVWEPP